VEALTWTSILALASWTIALNVDLRPSDTTNETTTKATPIRTESSVSGRYARRSALERLDSFKDRICRGILQFVDYLPITQEYDPIRV
jgi:hypothetical protein